MKELATDTFDVGNRLLRHLSMAGHKSPLSDLPPDSIIMAKSLMPSETVGLDRSHVVGIATEQGGPTSHAAILARSLGIPAVTGLTGVMDLAKPGTPALLDGAKGSLVLEPSDSQLQRFRGRRRSFEQSQHVLREMEGQVCRFKNGTRIQLMANINHVSDVGLASEHNLDGVGLFRTELIYLSVGAAPSSAVQYRHYTRAAIAVGNRPFTIRTFDFAVDKHPSFLSVDSTSLLQRGLRLALRQPRLFKSQLRAIVRAARDCPNIRVLFPMVTGRWELQEALEMLKTLSDDLQLQHRIPVGAMIETPAAVFCLSEIVEMVDFVSIGCNDLAQYTLAMERTAARNIGESTLHPVLLRAIQQIIDTASQADCPVSLCGEAASDPLLASIFAGLGIRDISVSPARAPVVRYALRHLTLTDARRLAEHAIHANPATVSKELQGMVPSALLPVIAMDHGDESMVRLARWSGAKTTSRSKA